MIEIFNYRNNGGGETLLSNPLVSMEDAMESLVKYELGYGGQISDVKASGDRTTIEIKTRVLSCQDRTVFDGPKDEMMPLLQACKVWMEAGKRVDMGKVASDLCHAMGGNALLITSSAGLAIGHATAQEALKLASHV